MGAASTGFTAVQKGALAASSAYVLDIAAFAILLPFLRAEFGLTDTEAVSLYSIYSATLCAALLCGGLVIDRLSVRLAFAGGVVLFALGALGLAAAPSHAWLGAARAVQGVGAGLMSPCIPLILAKAGGGEGASARNLTVWGFVSGLVAALCPLAISYLSGVAGWRALWAMVPLIALASLVPALGIPARLRGEEEGGRLSLGLDLALLYAFVFLAYGLTTWYIYAFPLFAAERFGMGLVGIGAMQTLLWLLFAVICFAMRERTSERDLVLYLAAGAALIGLGVAASGTSPWAAVPVGVGMALINMPTTELILRYAAPRARGMAASVDIVSARLGGAALVLLIPPGSGAAPWAGALGAAVMAAICARQAALLLPRAG